jgi:hypothetical protein
VDDHALASLLPQRAQGVEFLAEGAEGEALQEAPGEDAGRRAAAQGAEGVTVHVMGIDIPELVGE